MEPAAARRASVPTKTARAEAPPTGEAGSVATPPPGSGEKPPTEAELAARTEFETAQRHYDLGRFEEARAHYSRAYELLPLPAFLFNIAQCHRQLQRYEQAAFFYRRYLDLAENPANGSTARSLLTEMEKKRAEQETATNARAALANGVPSARCEETPPLKRWWVWAAAGAVVLAGGAAIAIGASEPSKTTLGTVNAR